MVRIFHPLLFLLARSTADDLQKQVEFLKAKNEMLRKRVLKKHIFLDSDERAKLLKLGKELGPDIQCEPRLGGLLKHFYRVAA